MKIIVQRSIFLFLVIALVVGVSFYVVIPIVKVASIKSMIQQIQTLPGFEGSTVVVDAKYEGSDDSVINENSSSLIHPGSNYKLLTAAASLHYLGADFVFMTNFYTFIDHGRQSLIIEGRGDPTFHWEDIQAMAKDIQKINPHITGDIYYDDSFFHGEPYGPDWKVEWKDIHFGVPISALQMDDNILYISGTGSAKKNNLHINTAAFQQYSPVMDTRILVNHAPPYTVRTVMSKDGVITLSGETSGDNNFATSVNMENPSLITAKTFKQELVLLGVISSQSKVRLLTQHPVKKLMYQHKSAPLREIVRLMLTFSKNNYGETLIRTLGEESNSTSRENGSQAKGVELLRMFLMKEVGIAPEDFVGRDGSGMSPSSRITGRAILRLFEYVNKQPWKDVYWNAFPTSNNEGTLRYRFLSAPIPDQVVAKTGTHDFASSLSGKIPRGRDTILFSVHIFHHHVPSEEIGMTVHPVIDTIVRLLDERL
ncbi:MAG: D-alanyl-D-alanine carboxypeptidase/D-alanyl-D-alanine-endopeptidase [Candidatus Peregrinibacteria bacterium]|nr:D-alanyl-D-alanine carboxypeptidase/D-alanyl-D-alanine-endopeptidase [Candidatus Peregrinibacteria bacterium]